MTYTGIDIVCISRFQKWLSFSPNQLSTIFTAAEIERLAHLHATANSQVREYQCLKFLASRFAAKEAFYKAVSSICAHRFPLVTPFGFRSLARFVSLSTESRWGSPQIIIHSEEFRAATGIVLPPLATTISISHDGEYAIAYVAITA